MLALENVEVGSAYANGARPHEHIAGLSGWI
jgi:hypothetical protein